MASSNEPMTGLLETPSAEAPPDSAPAGGAAEMIAENGSAAHASAAAPATDAAAQTGGWGLPILAAIACVGVVAARRRIDAWGLLGRPIEREERRLPSAEELDRGMRFAAVFLVLLVAPILVVPVIGGLDLATLRGRAIAQWAGYLAQAPVALFLVWMMVRTSEFARARGLLGQVVAGIAGLVVFVPFGLLASDLARRAQRFAAGVDPPAVAHETLRALLERPTDPWALAVIAAVVVGAPIIEEIAYRGGLHAALVRIGIGRIGAIVVGSAIFASMHVASIPPDSLAGALAMLFVLAIVLGLLRERTGGLVAPIVAHALFNAANIALAKASVQ
jgi:membrane protease YdiL (CAAX protease family)